MYDQMQVSRRDFSIALSSALVGAIGFLQLTEKHPGIELSQAPRKERAQNPIHWGASNSVLKPSQRFISA